MLCTVCDADMMLMKVEQNGTMTLLGSEYHAFRCSKCHQVKRHLVFIRHGREIENVPLLPYVALPIAPATTTQDERIGLLRRLAAKMRTS
jgi:hypothetical protein